MDTVLSVIRWIVHKLFLVLLATTVWLFIPLIAFSVNLTDSNQVKVWLDESNTYENFIDNSTSFLETEGAGALADQTQNSAIDNNALLEAIKPAIPADFLRQQAEIFIDGIYGWLDGTTVEPEFTVSFSEVQDDIKDAMRTELVKQLSAMPECNVSQITPTFDPFEANCIPPGTDINAAVNQAVDNVNSEDEFLTQEYTGKDLELSSEVLVNGPVAYDTALLLPFMYWFLLAGFGLLTIVTSRKWQRGFKEVGVSIGGASVILAFSAFIGGRLANAPGQYVIDQNDSGSQAEAARAIGEPLLKAVTADASSTMLLYSLITLLVAVVLFVIGWKTSNTIKIRDDLPELLKENEGENSYIDRVEKETKKEKKAKAKPKKKTKRKLVQ